MHFFTSLVALVAAVASAQSTTAAGSASATGATTTGTGMSTTGQYNVISITGPRPVVSAGANTIAWTNPSSGTVTIKLQAVPGSITPNSGIVVAQNIQSSAGTATINVPANDVVSGQSYVIEIIDDTGATQPNYTNDFMVTGATGTSTSAGSSTGTATTATGSSTATITATTSGSSTTGTASSTIRTSTTRTSTSAAATSTTVAPNAATKMSGAQGGLLVFVAGVIAIL